MTTTRTFRVRRFATVSTLLAVGAVALAACGASGSSDGSDKTTTTAAATTTATNEADSGAGGGGDGAVDATSETDPASYRGEIGKKVAYNCPADGKPSAVWGVETYTDDSSVCTAAVHVGLLTFADGGDVTVEIAESQDSYESGTANDVTSTSYASWPGSFTFPEAPPGSGEFAPSTESWNATARDLDEGETASVTCSPLGKTGSLWGTDTYTTDSSVCTAAVHAGLITVADGGTVTIEGVAGLDAYEGSEANGVTSQNYGGYGSSFTFPTP